MERKRKDSYDICVPVVWQAKTLALADDYRIIVDMPLWLQESKTLDAQAIPSQKNNPREWSSKKKVQGCVECDSFILIIS